MDKANPTLLVAHLHFPNHTNPNKKYKRATKPTHDRQKQQDDRRKTAYKH